ncbi:MAG: VWA domain-containing protein, partial [Rhodothermales bacterium]
MSFINSIFLFATAAAALPVLYHLVRRMKARKVPFSSLMFLRATPKELIRRRRLRDRLLMAARAALFGLLALAFARPYLPAEDIPFLSARESESVVILLDRSMSMRYAGAFERALEAARERIDAAAPGDELAVVSFADAADLRAPLGSDPAVRRAALSSIEPSFRTTDYYPALQRAQDVLREARHSRRVVVLISDFQDTGWSGTLENWKLDPGLVFEPVPVGSGAVNNAFVEDFQLSGRRSGGRYTLRYDARIASPGEGRSRSAALIVEGRESERRPIPSRSEVPLTFQHNAPREGPFQGSLEMEPDGLPEDDRYFFTARAETPPNILVLDTPSGAGLRDAFYLRNAFDLGEMSRFRFAAAERATSGTLDGNDVVFLANRVASGAGELSSLRSFVERGGTLILSPGDAASLSGLSRLLDEFGLGEIDHVVDARDEQGYEAIIGEVDMRHPIFAPFSERN